MNEEKRKKYDLLYPLLCVTRSGEIIEQFNSYKELKEYDKALSERVIYEKMLDKSIYRGHYWKQGTIENEKKGYVDVDLATYYGKKEDIKKTKAHYNLLNVKTKECILFKDVDDIAHYLHLEKCDNALNRLISEMKYYGLYPKDYIVRFIQEGIDIGDEKYLKL